VITVVGICTVALACPPAIPTALYGEDALGVKTLLSVRLSDIQTHLLPDTQVLIDAAAIEQFLHGLDGAPPDWAKLYGDGYHNPERDERLFQVNRERDAKREGHHALPRRIAFVWSGELSTYESGTGGFHVALGPRFTPTSWGMVRFKPEDLPGNLTVVLTSPQREDLHRRMSQKQSIELDVVMAGTLVPEESILYDFLHEQDGLGVIMPVVRVEDVFYLLAPLTRCIEHAP
jgi:hypothetical protein